MKKRISIFMMALTTAAVLFSAIPAMADTTKTFSDNFSSGNLSKWTNANTDDDKNNDDKNLNPAKTWKIVDDGGKALQFDTDYDQSSFDYLTPDGVVASEFTITWKMKALVLNDTWAGWSVLKDTKDRYNGCNNVFIVFRFTDGKISTQIYRGYPGAGAPISYVGKMTGTQYVNADPTQYHSYKIDYHAGVYTCYVDNAQIASLSYTSKSLPQAGFISLNSCINKANFKDINISYVNSSTSAPSSAVTSATTKNGSGSGTTAAAQTRGGVTSSNKNEGGVSSVTSQITSDTTAAATSSESSAASTDSSLSSTADTTSATAANTKPKESNAGLIIGIVAAAVIVLGGGGAALYFLVIKKKLNK